MMYLTNNRMHAILIILLLLISCGKKEEDAHNILVQIDDKTITIDEFKQRAEFTVRPEIFAEKSIVLNNLIAEKLLALEAERNEQILQQEQVQNFVKGIREQTMREQLFFSEIYNNVQIETKEIDEAYPLSIRAYELEFYTIGNKTVADSLSRLIEGQPDQAPQIFDQIAVFDSVPKHTMSWDDPDSYVIHDALFTKPLSENAVVGPLHLEDDTFLIAKIIGWKDQPVIGPEEVASRRLEIQKKLKEKKSEKEWQMYMQNVMKGKAIEFVPDIFNKVVELSYSVYAQGVLEDKLPIEDRSQQKEPAQFALGELMNDPSFRELTFFTINSESWSVEKFKNELASHPLVFRKSRIFTFKEYKRQFRAAVADLVRDHYLTQIAYQKKLDKAPTVLRTVMMWRDATLAQNQWYTYANALRNRPGFNPQNMKGQNNYLGQYVDSLLSAYHDRISVDYQHLQKIELTTVPMYVYKPGMPFPSTVPVFPQLTLKDALTY
jgi:hypothetical protein